MSLLVKAEKPGSSFTGLSPDWASSAVAAGNLKIAGFLLGVDDPFAEGAARVFAKQKGLKTARLPIVLPYKDKASVEALESYILRAGGAGDTDRVKAAEKALEKVK